MVPGFLVLALCASLPLSAWGKRGHEKVAALALLDLPPEVAAWFRGQEEVLKGHASDPDYWKKDPKEGRRHFMDVDPYGGAASVPTKLEDAVALLGAEAVQKAGIVPWIIQDRMRDLAQAFKAGDPAQAAFLSSILSHYVGDLHVPLHTTSAYDGHSGQKGVHSRWETGLVDKMVVEPEVRRAVAEPGLYTAPWKWLRESNALVASVLEDDRSAAPAQDPGSRSTTRPPAYWMRFSSRQEPVAREQLARAGQHTAQMILLAWALGGSPPAPGQPSVPAGSHPAAPPGDGPAAGGTPRD